MLKAAKDSPAQGQRTPRTQNVLTASQPSVPGSQWDEEARPLFEAVPFCTVLPLTSSDPLPLRVGQPEHLVSVPVTVYSNHHTHGSSKHSGLPWRLYGKGSASNAGDGFDPWGRKIPWRREWQPTPVFLPGKSHGQRSLEGYSPWDCMTERLNSNAHLGRGFVFWE